jgi:hypothetical protein
MKKLNIFLLSALLVFSFSFSPAVPHEISSAQTSSCITLTKTLYIGLKDSGTLGQVSQLQNFLKTYGYYTYPTITGFFGGVTQAAVQSFQSANGVVSGGTPATTGYGIVGPMTAAKIKNISCGYQVPASGSAQLPLGCLAGYSYNTLTGAPCTSTPTIPGCSPGFLYSILTGVSCTGGPLPLTTPPQCIDTIDNDGDGKIDSADPGCSSSTDNTEVDVIKKCSNGIDDDFDGKIDYPNDPDCSSPTDNSESNSTIKCSDGLDNDGDDVIDYPYEPGCSSATDTSEDNGPVFLTQVNFAPSVKSIASSLGAKDSYIIGSGSIDPQDTGFVNLALMDQTLGSSVNGILHSYTGYAVIDLEDSYHVGLRKPANDPHFIQAQEQMLKALNHAKAWAPNAKWGYYHLPLNYFYFGGGVNWDTASEAQKTVETALMAQPSALISAVDFLSPSVYNPYPQRPPNDTPDYLIPRTRAYIREAVKRSIQMADGKPVFPYISRTSFNGNDPTSYSRLDPDDFQDTELKHMLNDGADGVILWGADYNFYNLAYNTNPIPPARAEEAAMIKDHMDEEIPVALQNFTNPHDSVYFNTLHEQTLRLTAESLFGINYTPTWPLFEIGGDDEDPEPVCGDGNVDSGEECDGSNFAGASCTSEGFDSGSISCSSSCNINTSLCVDDSADDGAIDLPGGGGDGTHRGAFLWDFFNQFAAAFQVILNIFHFNF